MYQHLLIFCGDVVYLLKINSISLSHNVSEKKIILSVSSVLTCQSISNGRNVLKNLSISRLFNVLNA
jgi:hypothetical protein